MKPLLIVGSGGHAAVVIEAARLSCWEIVGLLDDFLPVGSVRHGVTVIGKAIGEWENHAVFFAIGDNQARVKLWSRMAGCNEVSITHPRAYVSTSAKYAPGCFFACGSYVGQNCVVGAHSIINTNASLDHDSKLGAFSHLAPGAVTGGRVTIGSGTFVGMNACIRDGVTIGGDCTIGMGAVVVKDVTSYTTEYGNPARVQ